MNKLVKWLMGGLILCAVCIIGCSHVDDADSEVIKSQFNECEPFIFAD